MRPILARRAGPATPALPTTKQNGASAMLRSSVLFALMLVACRDGLSPTYTETASAAVALPNATPPAASSFEAAPGASIADGSRTSDQTAEVSAQRAALTPETAAKSPVPPDMLEVPGGEFVMGADNEGELDERPAHRVTVAMFLLDKTEVSNASYSECVKAERCRPAESLEGSPLVNGRAREFRLPDHPVVGVSWDDAKTYCAWRGRRLPREAEWERASRGDDGRRYVWGNAEPDPKQHGVFGGQTTTQPIGSFPHGRGPYGHLDLAGNAWEWMEDAYDPYAYRRSTANLGIPGSCDEILKAQDELRREGKQGFTGTNPIPTVCERVLRGGAYNYRTSGLRASNRVHHPANFRIAVAGFRCARDR